MTKIEGIVAICTVQLASYMDVLYIIEFSLRSNGSQWRSICVFEAYIEGF